MRILFPASLLVAAITTSAYAEVQVEEKPLSAAVKTQPLTSGQPLQSQSLDNTAPSAQWELYQQVQQLQQEVRNLRGQLEVQANQIDKLKQDARSRYLDLDQRLSQMNSRVGSLQQTVEQQNTNNNTTPTNTATPPAGMAVTSLNTTTTTPVAATPAATTTQPTATPTPDSTTPTVNPDDDKKAYFSAYEVFRSGGPNKAINPMRNFIKNYPQSSYIPSAYYWLGEFYLAASPADMNNAQKAFKIVAEQFPDTPKVPAALYKLASLADVNSKVNDAAKYMQDIIKHHSSSPEAALARNYLQEHNIPVADKKPSDKNKDPANKPKDNKPAKDDNKMVDSHKPVEKKDKKAGQ